ncbi:MAG: hypothetical protein COB33_009825 [Thiotrichaceae bacterium]|nr:hypothetical protein [Thiotrichaceae bacterium]
MISGLFHRLTTIRQFSSYNFVFILGMVGIVLLACMVGISAAYGFFLISGGLVALIYVLILYAILGRNTASGIKDVFFWVMFMAVFLAASIHKFTGYSAYYVLELCLIVAAPLLVIRLVHLVNESSFFRLWFAAFSVFLLLSLLSSVFGRSNELAAAYQFISNLKIVLLLLIGFYITWSPRTETVFWWLIQWLWLPMMLLVAWQWGHPSSYFGLMGHASPASADPLNLFPSRALGAFQHPTYLGLYAGVFTIFCFLNATLGAGRRYIIFGVCYFFLLLASTQRQETVAAIVVIAGIISLLQGKRFIIRNAIIGLFVILLVGGGAWFQFNDNLMNEAERWGLIGHDKIEQPRQLLYYHSVDIANQNAPLGSGLGTFAGAGALKFDISLYLDRGFNKFSWFYTQNVLMDTYWANFLAETGWAATLLFMFLLLLLIWYPAAQSLKDFPPEVQRVWLMAFAGMSFTLILSLTSPAFQDPGLFLVPGVFLGVAYNRTARWVSKEKSRHGG